MNTIKRKWDCLSTEQKKLCTENIIEYLQSEHDIEIGVIAATEIVELVTEHTAKPMYNQGIQDAKALVLSKAEDLSYELDTLKYCKRAT